MKTYRVPEPHQSEPIYLYRYKDEVRSFHALRALPDDYKSRDFETEEHLILAWADFSKSAFGGEYSESAIPCWDGHYEQFGRVMLEVARLSDRRSSLCGFAPAVIDAIFPPRNCVWQPQEHNLYRAWFSLIGHPDFQPFDGGIGPMYSEHRANKFMLGIAIHEVSRELRLLAA
jgi:hypothetical protein